MLIQKVKLKNTSQVMVLKDVLLSVVSILTGVY